MYSVDLARTSKHNHFESFSHALSGIFSHVLWNQVSQPSDKIMGPSSCKRHLHITCTVSILQVWWRCWCRRVAGKCRISWSCKQSHRWRHILHWRCWM